MPDTTAPVTLANLADDPDIEQEDELDFQDIVRPWDPESIRVGTNNFSLRNMIDSIKERGLDLAPDFQRLKVWSRVQKAQLIESILLQIPLPAFYFAEDTEGVLRVVDGVQRLTTINDFVTGGTDGQGGFKLDGLEYIADVMGKRFSDLPTLWQRRIYNTQIVAHVIAPSTPSEVMYDIFRRINTGGTPLTGQEIRHCISKTRSRAFLKSLVEKPVFNLATGGNLFQHKRMVDREVALRFVAFWYLTPDAYQPKETLDGFLLRALHDIDAPQVLDDSKLDEIAKSFEQGLVLARRVFEDNAFRKWPFHASRRNPFNRALFESWTVELARTDPLSLSSTTCRLISQKAREAMTRDLAYIASVSSATGDFQSVKTRFDTTRTIIQRAVEQ